MKEAYDDKSYRSYNRIDESDDRLCLKYQSKPSSDLFCYHCPFIIEKSEISIFYLSEKFFYAFSVDNEEVRKYQCNKEFCQNNPSICDISDSFLSYCFQIVWAYHIADEATEPKFETRAFFYFYDKVFSLEGDIRGFLQKPLYLTSYLGKYVHEYENNNADKYDVKSCDDDIGSCIFLCDDMSTISFSTDSPCMYLRGEVGTKLEKYIREEKRHKKEDEKIFQRISDQKEETIGDDLFPKYFSEYDGKECFNSKHKKNNKS